MSAIEASPLGAVRERETRCFCGTPTWNWSATCDRCLSSPLRDRPLPLYIEQYRALAAFFGLPVYRGDE